MAATLLVTILLGREVAPRFGQAGAVMEILELVVLIAFLIAVPAGVLISGSVSLWFWIGVVAVGMLIPLALEILTWRTSPKLAALAMAVSVLLGGVVLRAVVVVGGQV
jgi:polysulfide reductase chain C